MVATLAPRASAPEGWRTDPAHLAALRRALDAGATWESLAARDAAPPRKYRRVYAPLVSHRLTVPDLVTAMPGADGLFEHLARVAVMRGWVAARRQARAAGLLSPDLRGRLQPIARQIVEDLDPVGDGPSHGTFSRYTNIDCRCEPCRFANSLHVARATTGPSRSVAAAPVAATARAGVASGVSVRSVARAASVSPRTLSAIMEGTTQRVRTTTARRLNAACRRLTKDGAP